MVSYVAVNKLMTEQLTFEVTIKKCLWVHTYIDRQNFCFIWSGWISALFGLDGMSQSLCIHGHDCVSFFDHSLPLLRVMSHYSQRHALYQTVLSYSTYFSPHSFLWQLYYSLCIVLRICRRTVVFDCPGHLLSHCPVDPLTTLWVRRLPTESHQLENKFVPVSCVRIIVSYNRTP